MKACQWWVHMAAISEPFYKCVLKNKIIVVPAKDFQGLQLPNDFILLFIFFATQTLTSAACQVHFHELPPPVNHSESLIKALPRRL